MRQLAKDTDRDVQQLAEGILKKIFKKISN